MQSTLEDFIQRPIVFHFGPAGWLSARLHQGEHADLFLSANLDHPKSLLATHPQAQFSPFCANALCLTVRRSLSTDHSTWQTLIQNHQLRFAASTPKHDPSGDYAWRWFEQLGKSFPDDATRLKTTTQSLVGYPNAPAIPPQHTAASWLIETDQADVFIGYAHYRPLIEANALCRYIAIPAEWNISVEYGLIAFSDLGKRIAEYLCGPKGQSALQDGGFLPVKK